MINLSTDFVGLNKKDFVVVCGFKKRPFRKKLVMSNLWRDLDTHKNNLQTLKKYLKSFRCVVLETPVEDPLEQIPISGYYTPDNNTIELFLATNSYDLHTFTDKTWWEFKFMLIQVLWHEVVHMMQFSNRDFFWSDRKCKFRKVKSESVNEDRKYHSTMDEIQAYAHCIFLELMQFYGSIPKKEKEKCNYRISVTYNMLVKVFGGRVNEPVIHKTLYYINQWEKKYAST